MPNLVDTATQWGHIEDLEKRVENLENLVTKISMILKVFEDNINELIRFNNQIVHEAQTIYEAQKEAQTDGTQVPPTG